MHVGVDCRIMHAILGRVGVHVRVGVFVCVSR